MTVRPLLTLAIATLFVVPPAHADDWARIRDRGYFIWGADEEGGGPYAYPDPRNPDRIIGFEVDLAERIAQAWGVRARFRSGIWDNLPDLLRAGQIDMIINGYELTAARAATMEHTIPYYVYDLVLLVHRDSPIRDWSDLKQLVAGHKPRVGVLVASGAHEYAEKQWGDWIELLVYEGNTEAMRDVEIGKIDAVIVDRPIAIFYRDRYPLLRVAGEPVAPGYYVIYVRKGERRLRDELNAVLAELILSGELKEICAQYGIWTEAQQELVKYARDWSTPVRKGTVLRGWDVIRERGPLLLKGAWMTVYLSLLSFPLAIALGVLLAVARLFGPGIVRLPALLYIELMRGTPLMLQLYVIFYVLPEFGIHLQPVQAAILGLALNYAAYESEIFRAGIQAIPAGQIQAALALGMSWWQTLRRVVLPQAIRIVIPPVTNDFIALFKDTSVCSVITVFELTRQYSVQRNDTGATVELALVAAALYLCMSVPLAHLAARAERRLSAQNLHMLTSLRRVV